MPHDHWLLMGAIACLYLHDSALWLYHNEVVLETRGKRHRVSAGSAMEFGGRHLLLPNPCFPHRALARLTWPHGGSPDWRPLRWKRSQQVLSAIAPWTWWLLCLFFVGLPLALHFGTDVLLLGWLVLTYLSITAMLAQVWRHRNSLGLSSRQVAALAADALLCAPFALNTVRKISLRQAATATLHGFASSVLSADEYTGLAKLLRDRVRISLDHVEPDSEAASTLRDYVNRYGDHIA